MGTVDVGFSESAPKRPRLGPNIGLCALGALSRRHVLRNVGLACQKPDGQQHVGAIHDSYSALAHVAAVFYLGRRHRLFKHQVNQWLLGPPFTKHD